MRRLRTGTLWFLGFLAAVVIVSLVQGLGTPGRSQAVEPAGDGENVAPALPVAAATRVPRAARMTPTPPLSYAESRQRLRGFAAALKHDNLVSGATQDREQAVVLLERVEDLSVTLDRLLSNTTEQSDSGVRFTRIQRDIITLAGAVGSYPPLFEDSHDRYTVLVGYLRLLYGSMTALEGLLRFEQRLQQGTPVAS
ncbi:MAG: hypothetical protein CL878_15310 [Dehalococcoidia bacterium]|nr:hypothetical protein [Dehalococcoidia bacterium]